MEADRRVSGLFPGLQRSIVTQLLCLLILENYGCRNLNSSLIFDEVRSALEGILQRRPGGIPPETAEKILPVVKRLVGELCLDLSQSRSGQNRSDFAVDSFVTDASSLPENKIVDSSGQVLPAALGPNCGPPGPVPSARAVDTRIALVSGERNHGDLVEQQSGGPRLDISEIVGVTDTTSEDAESKIPDGQTLVRPICIQFLLLH